VAEEELTFFGGETQLPSKDPNQPPQAIVAVGNLISDQYFSGGQIDATILFDRAVDLHSGCEVILYYEPATGYFVSSGLGGWPGQFGGRCDWWARSRKSNGRVKRMVDL